MWKSTGELRWLVIVLDGGFEQRELQQEWRNETTGEREWRNVPITRERA